MFGDLKVRLSGAFLFLKATQQKPCNKAVSNYSCCPVFGDHHIGHVDGFVALLKFYRKALNVRITFEEKFFHR